MIISLIETDNYLHLTITVPNNKLLFISKATINSNFIQFTKFCIVRTSFCTKHVYGNTIIYIFSTLYDYDTVKKEKNRNFGNRYLKSQYSFLSEHKLENILTLNMFEIYYRLQISINFEFGYLT